MLASLASGVGSVASGARDMLASLFDADDGSARPARSAGVEVWARHALYLVTQATTALYASEEAMEELSTIDYASPRFEERMARVYASVSATIDSMVAARIAADYTAQRLSDRDARRRCNAPALRATLRVMERKLTRAVSESELMADDYEGESDGEGDGDGEGEGEDAPTAAQSRGTARGRLRVIRDLLGRAVSLLREAQLDQEQSWPSVVEDARWGADGGAVDLNLAPTQSPRVDAVRRRSDVGIELFRTAFS